LREFNLSPPTVVNLGFQIFPRQARGNQIVRPYKCTCFELGLCRSSSHPVCKSLWPPYPWGGPAQGLARSGLGVCSATFLRPSTCLASAPAAIGLVRSLSRPFWKPSPGPMVAADIAASINTRLTCCTNACCTNACTHMWNSVRNPCPRQSPSAGSQAHLSAYQHYPRGTLSFGACMRASCTTILYPSEGF
jgi:hypothetical protein